MNIGLIGYLSLRRDLLQPIAVPDCYYALIADINKVTGEYVHFIPMKKLTPDCHVPPLTAEPDEIAAHQAVIHYGDCMSPLVRYVNQAPSKDRREYLREHPFDWSKIKYRVPILDVALVECSSQMGVAYAIDQLLQALYTTNPDVGFILIENDWAAQTTISKMKRWHPNFSERTVVMTHHPVPKYANQMVGFEAYLEFRQHEPVLDRNELCYVGNDYTRREIMLKFFKAPFHWYGRCKPDFEEEIKAIGCELHGPFTDPVELAYRRHGIGLNIAQARGCQANYVALRPMEVIQAGCVCMCDRQLPIMKPILSDWCMVDNADDMQAKAGLLPSSPGFWADLVNYQRQSVAYYLSRQRRIESLWTVIQALTDGPARNLQVNPYDDLCKAAGIGRFVQHSVC